MEISLNATRPLEWIAYCNFIDMGNIALDKVDASMAEKDLTEAFSWTKKCNTYLLIQSSCWDFFT